MAKPKELPQMSLDDLVRHQFQILLDLKQTGQIGESDALFLVGYELLRRFNPPANN